MSGHSKWSTIKRDKGLNDAKRGQIFTKYANAIAIAARSGGGNPEANFKLRLTIEAARAINMPKDNIERAIQRGTGSAAGSAALEEVIYEGFAPHGVALLIEAVTDNRQRTSAQIRSILDKAGGSLAGPGATSFQFKKQGEIVVTVGDKNKEEMELEMIDLGATDVEEAGNLLLVYTKPEELESIKEKISQSDHIVESAGLTMLPTTGVNLTDKESANKVLNVIEKLEELDDIQKVYANLDIPEELVAV